MIDHAEVREEYHRLSRLIDAGVEALREQSHTYAQAERDYRKAKSDAWVRCPIDDPGIKAGEREWTAARREAWVNAQTADLRQTRDLADAMRSAALEALRARRSQLSALQTLVNADTEEAKFARTGPQ